VVKRTLVGLVETYLPRLLFCQRYTILKNIWYKYHRIQNSISLKTQRRRT